MRAPALMIFALCLACSRDAQQGGRLDIGERVVGMRLLEDDGTQFERELDTKPAATVLWFWSSKCACVRDCEERILALLERYKDKNVEFIAIDSNPGDSREAVEKLRKKLGSPYPVLRDSNGWTVKHVGVTASASVAVLDGDLRLRFRGAIDDDRYRPTVSYVHKAVDAILAGQPVDPTSVTPYGCLYPLSE